MNVKVYAYSFFDLETAEMRGGLLIADSREQVLESIKESGFHAIGISVRAMPDLLPALTVDYEGNPSIEIFRLRQLSHELLIRKGGGDL